MVVPRSGKTLTLTRNEAEIHCRVWREKGLIWLKCHTDHSGCYLGNRLQRWEASQRLRPSWGDSGGGQMVAVSMVRGHRTLDTL